MRWLRVLVARRPGPANHVPISSSRPTQQVVMLAFPSRSVATHQMAWPAARASGSVVSESTRAYCRPLCGSGSARARRRGMPQAIARSVRRRSREMATAIPSTASAGNSQRDREQPQELDAGLRRPSCCDFSSVILPVPGGSDTAPFVRWVSVFERSPTSGLRSIATVPLAVLSGPDPPFRIVISWPWAFRFAARHSSTTRGRARPASTARWMYGSAPTAIGPAKGCALGGNTPASVLGTATLVAKLSPCWPYLTRPQPSASRRRDIVRTFCAHPTGFRGV